MRKSEGRRRASSSVRVAPGWATSPEKVTLRLIDGAPQQRAAYNRTARGEDERKQEDRRSAHRGSIQMVKAALMTMEVGETESLK